MKRFKVILLDFKGVTKLQPPIIFVSTTELGESTTTFSGAIFQDKYTTWHIKLTIYI